MIPKSKPELGLYIYTDVATLLAKANNLSSEAATELSMEMAKAINTGRLQVRNPETGGLAKAGSSAHVTFEDISNWLTADGYPYRLEHEETATGEKTSAPESATNTNIFQTMDNLAPEEISIIFVGEAGEFGMGNNMLEITARATTRRIALSEIGLTDRRGGTLNSQGAILLGFAHKNKLKVSTKNSKQMSRLRGVLQSYLGVKSDMFFPHNKSDGWAPRFNIQENLGAAKKRAETEAQRRTVSLDQMNESSEKAHTNLDPDDDMDSADDWLAKNDPEFKK